ncbi:hypothetical protein CCHL11_07036 [Colletotrichum chlorophyti]|uniref:Uncharacterized protein n=1 Tax=Colletotrichum chlorophyti TaxID=708187 RepID=A0A1Q8RC36_9PEZI|nr:hypothetical protein CCHL11_07036 [Colletotrichum chlorophyti]
MATQARDNTKNKPAAEQENPHDFQGRDGNPSTLQTENEAEGNQAATQTENVSKSDDNDAQEPQNQVARKRNGGPEMTRQQNEGAQKQRLQQQPQQQQQPNGQQITAQNKRVEKSGKGAPSVKLDMDLDVEVELKAKIKGDLELSILGG